MVLLPSKASFCQRPDNRDDEGREKVGDADFLFVPQDVPSDAEDEYTANEGDRIKHVRSHDWAKQTGCEGNRPLEDKNGDGREKDAFAERSSRDYGPRIDNCTDSDHEIILAQSGGPGCR